MPGSSYVPDRGDLVWLDFDPQAGKEGAELRSALVLSHLDYNHKTGRALFCLITTQAKGYPFEVALPPSPPVTGVVLADYLRNLDWRSCKAAYKGKAPAAVLSEVTDKLAALLEVK
jgi:mRNA interferase MazF